MEGGAGRGCGLDAAPIPSTDTMSSSSHSRDRMDSHLVAWTTRRESGEPISHAQIASNIDAVYAAAGLTRPHVVVVPSPLVMAIAGVIAEYIWDNLGNRFLSANGPLSDTRDPVLQAVLSATGKLSPSAARTSGTASLSLILSTLFDQPHQLLLARIWTAHERRLSHLEPRFIHRVNKFWALDQEVHAAIDLAIASISASSAGNDHASSATRLIARQLLEDLGAPDVVPQLQRWESRFHGRNYLWAPVQGLLLPTPRYVGGAKVPQFDGFDAWEHAEINGGFRYDHPKFSLISDFPEVVRFDDLNRLHCADGPSCRWRDGWALYHLHGVRVPEHVVMNPHAGIRAHIAQRRSPMVIREMINRIGPIQYIRDTGVRYAQRDAFGLLYRIEPPNDELMVMVRVLNATAEANGTLSRDEAIRVFGPAARVAAEASPETRWNEYVLQVPSFVRRARQGVAWTFGMGAGRYNPEFES